MPSFLSWSKASAEKEAQRALKAQKAQLIKDLTDPPVVHYSGIMNLARTIKKSKLPIGDPAEINRLWERAHRSVEYEGIWVPNKKLARVLFRPLLSSSREFKSGSEWLECWKLFSIVAPQVLRKRLLDDIRCAYNVYEEVKVEADVTSSTKITFEVVAKLEGVSLDKIAVRNHGGGRWEMDPEYAVIRRKWTMEGFHGLPPSVVFVGAALAKSTVTPGDRGSCRMMQMLGLMSEDLDLAKKYKAIFWQLLEFTRENVFSSRPAIRRAAVATLLNIDILRYNRSKQMQWKQQKDKKRLNASKPMFTHKHDHFWASGNILDCTAILGFGYEDEDLLKHEEKSTGLFAGRVWSSMFTVLWDKGSEDKLNCTMYANQWAKSPRSEIHSVTAAIAFSCIDDIARRILTIRSSQERVYGDSYGIIIAAWSPFNTRNRTFERFVKYGWLLLKHPNYAEADTILRSSADPMIAREVIQDSTMNDGYRTWAWSWRAAFREDVKELLIKREVKEYTLPSAEGLMDTPIDDPLDICVQCLTNVHDVLRSKQKLYAIPGLTRVVSCNAVIFAAAISQVAIHATNKDFCCEPCAPKIGIWCDQVSYRVLVALMISEEETSSRQWMLQCYAVASTCFTPICIPTVLAGFELIAKIKWGKGAKETRPREDIIEGNKGRQGLIDDSDDEEEGEGAIVDTGMSEGQVAAV